MKANDRNICQLKAYLQVQRVLYLLILMACLKMLREVLGIDGLRQDVLYGPDKENVKDTIGNYYINPLELPGIGEILKGHQLSEANQQYIMLPEVTAVFPSITLASWASIFTGKMPKDTGILGNEFFARDLYETGRWWNIPGMWNHGLPKGMITLSDGAFPNNTLDYYLRNLMPAHNYYDTTVDRINNSPQNLLLSPEEATYPDDPSAQTIYEWLRSEESIQDRMSQLYRNTGACMDGGDCQSAVFFSHYARGTDWWGTQDRKLYQQRAIEWLGDSVKVIGKFVPQKAAEILDEMPTKEALDFLETYFENKDRKFPALFTLYYGGPDHYAHDFGLDGSVDGYSGYSDYFKKYTDRRIREVMNKLRELDEFDNKIFIITADHGHTGMPTGMTHTDKKTGTVYDADTSCKLTLKDFDEPETQNPELANNNLHIWELGEVMKLMPTGEVTPEGKKLYYKVLAPTEIVKANKGETTTDDPKQADIIAAFNGPVAHIYIKGENGWDDDPKNELLIKVADLFQASLAEGDGPITRLASSIDTILVRLSRNSEYVVYSGAANTGSQISLINPIPVSSYFSNNTKYVDALNRIRGMNNPDRSGDIILIFKDFTDDEAINRYTSGTACKSWHGSLNPSDSYVPLILAYPGGKKAEIESVMNNVAACPNGQCEGNWNVTDIIKEIIKRQFSEN